MGAEMLTGAGLQLSKPFPKQGQNIPYQNNSEKKKKKTIGSGKNVKYPELDPSIRDSEDDWLTRQIKEEDEAYKRTCEMFGIHPHVSDATVLRVEHALEHGYQKATQAYR